MLCKCSGKYIDIYFNLKITFFPQQDGRRLQKNHLLLYDVDELLQDMVATGFMLLPISQDVNYLIYLCTFRNWRLFFVVFFASSLFSVLILLLGSMHLFSLHLRRVTALTPPTIALLLSLRLLPRFSKLCLIPTSSNNLLSDHQYGFRKARSTGDLLSYLTHTWSSSLRDFGESFVVALDISKAFDKSGIRLC